MYETKTMPVINPVVEVRLRCLESAVKAWSATNATKFNTDAKTDLLQIAETFEEWVLRPKEEE